MVWIPPPPQWCRACETHYAHPQGTLCPLCDDEETT